MSYETIHPIKRQKPDMSTDEEPVEAQMDSSAMNRFSRQNAALGAETTAKLIKMRVIIVGMRGVGVETAKNLSLQGAGGITLVDSAVAAVEDVGSNFFISETDVLSSKSRAEICAPKLRELNPLCAIRVASHLSEELVATHSAVVIADSSMPLTELLSWNSFCREKHIAFFYAFIGGVSASVFSDLGPMHVVHDPTGGRPMQKLLTGVIAIDDSTALLHYETPEGQPPIALSDGTYDVSDVTGVPGINGCSFEVSHPSSDPVKTVRINFSVPSNAKYEHGGQMIEKKIPKPYPMDSLEYKLKHPGSPFAEPPSTVLTDMINFGGETQQHVAMYATLAFAERNGNRLPAANSASDAAEVLAIAEELLRDRVIELEDFELDPAFVKTYAALSAVELQPMAAFIGGVLGQEVVKCTGKFTPIPGFLHFCAREVLPSAAPSDTSARGSRYDALAAAFGWEFVEKLHGLQYFMVGCGALGCEFMKNFALNGVCCGVSGRLVVTDADRIELSNLSRQFLFREHNVGQPKSRAAAAMAKVMNPGFNVEAYEMFVGPKTEDTFNDEFWLNLSGVCNALDNMV